MFQTFLTTAVQSAQDPTNWITVISQVGFPIAVASYTLIRLEKAVKDNTTMLTKLFEKLDNK